MPVQMFVIESSSTAKNTFNPIRNIVDKCKVSPNPNKKVISLSLGDPTVFGNLKTDEAVEKAMIKAICGQEANGYAPSIGTEIARKAIADRYQQRFSVTYDSSDIFIASGCSGALDLAISVLCGPGDAILLPKPGFTLYQTLAGSKGIKSLNYSLDETKKWEIKLEEVENFLKNNFNVKAWLINNPSNPCGSVYSKTHLEDCLKLAKKYNVIVIADEIYEDLVFEGNEYIPLARISEEIKVPILTCSGLAKIFLVPGWRFGWIALKDPYPLTETEIKTNSSYDLSQIRKGLFDLATLIIGSCTLIQSALPDIFSNTPEKFYKNTNNFLAGNAEFLVKKLKLIDGLKVIEPQGTLYMLVGVDFNKFNGQFQDDLQLSELLLSQQSISVLPGSIFGMPGYFRIVFSAPLEIIEEFCERLKDFFYEYRKII